VAVVSRENLILLKKGPLDRFQLFVFLGTHVVFSQLTLPRFSKETGLLALTAPSMAEKMRLEVRILKAVCGIRPTAPTNWTGFRVARRGGQD